MKNFSIKNWGIVLILLFVLVVAVVAEEKTLVKPKDLQDSERVTKPQRPVQPTKPAENKDQDTKTPEKEAPKPPVTTVVPDIPKDWGDLVNSQFLMDGAYLTFTFQDKNGIIRVATFKKNLEKNSVDLYTLMIFNRTDKNDLKPVAENPSK